MKKSEFIHRVSKMSKPQLEEIYPVQNHGLLSTCWVVEDKADLRKYFCTPAVNLKGNDYKLRKLTERNHKRFYERETAARNKYQRWLNEVLEAPRRELGE